MDFKKSFCQCSKVMYECIIISKGWVSWKSKTGEQGLGIGDPYMITFFLFYKIFGTES